MHTHTSAILKFSGRFHFRSVEIVEIRKAQWSIVTFAKGHIVIARARVIRRSVSAR